MTGRVERSFEVNCAFPSFSVTMEIINMRKKIALLMLNDFVDFQLIHIAKLPIYS